MMDAFIRLLITFLWFRGSAQARLVSCQKAAEQGDAYAQYNLGEMYYYGQGVAEDYIQAYMWFSLSGENGVKETSESRDTLADKMSAEQINEAQKLAGEWMASHP